MAYEYENTVVAELTSLGMEYNSNAHYEMADEVEEVYIKAKAWQKLKEEKTNNYITYPNAEKRDDLIRMDELDGTHEFSNLLDDMNREDK